MHQGIGLFFLLFVGGIATSDDVTTIEGDILVDFEKYKEGNLFVGALTSEKERWKEGQIKYVMDSNFNQTEKEIILDAMQEIERKSCVRFEKPAESAVSYVKLVKSLERAECATFIGRNQHFQDFYINPGKCMSFGQVLHLLMHVLGFLHEHNRYDRDNYVEIKYENLLPAAKGYFTMREQGETDDFETGYDYHSIMHFGNMAYSKNGQMTIVGKRRGAHKMGKWKKLSRIDVKRINSLYRCDQHKSNGPDSKDTKAVIKETLEEVFAEWMLNSKTTSSATTTTAVLTPGNRLPPLKVNGVATSKLMKYKEDVKNGRIKIRGVTLAGWLIAVYETSKNSPAWKDVPEEVAIEGEYSTMQYLRHNAIPRECPSGWTHNGTFCYFFSDDLLSHDSAEKSCSAKLSGAHLASVTSADENNFILRLYAKKLPVRTDNFLNRTFRIGLKRDVGSLRPFYWQDNTPFEYANWKTGEPNGGQYELCVEVHESNIAENQFPPGTWNDVECGRPIRYVCKGPAVAEGENPNSRAESQFKAHRDQFYTEKDFEDIAAAGLNTVKIPVGYWIVGFDHSWGEVESWKAYAPGALDFLDRAMRQWALKYNLLVIISMQAAKGSQNGRAESSPTDFSFATWGDNQENVNNTLDAMSWLSTRYRDDEAFLGVELLENPQDQSIDTLRQYFYDSFGRIRYDGHSDCMIIVSPDLAEPEKEDWKGFMLWPNWWGIRYDYPLDFSTGYEGKRVNELLKLVHDYKKKFNSWRGNWLFVGSWNLATPVKMNVEQLHKYAEALLYVFSSTKGWCFSAWKSFNDSDVSHPNVNSLKSLLQSGIIKLKKV